MAISAPMRYSSLPVFTYALYKIQEIAPAASGSWTPAETGVIVENDQAR